MINLNKKSRKLILLQRNELLTNEQRFIRKKFGRFMFTNFFVYFLQFKNLNNLTEELFKKELNTFEKYLPSNIKNVLDIGCGLGILHILLNQKYKNKPEFFLLDKSKIDLKIKYGFNKNYESYNDLKETRNILLKNGILEEQIFIKNVDEEININKKIDLVISLKSMGYHYPIENYTNLFKKICTEITEFIIDISNDNYNIEYVERYFDKVKLIYQEDSIHPLKRLHCKGFKFIDKD